MKFFISLVLIAALSFAGCLYLPWWVIAIAGFVVAFAIPQKAGIAFLCGFLALFILWVGMSFYISNANDNLLAHKIYIIFVKTDNPIKLFLLTGLIGGSVAGLGSLSGRYFRKMFAA